MNASPIRSISPKPHIFTCFQVRIYLLVGLTCLLLCSACSKEENIVNPSKAEGTVITYVNSEGIGNIAVKVMQPETARFEEGAGVVVNVATFFTTINSFNDAPDFTEIGLITISYLWPGKADIGAGAESDGTYDYGGDECIQALRDVIRFAGGTMPDRDGNYLSQLIKTTPCENNIGLYAFSHPGIAAVNVLAIHQNELAFVDYFVGRENPTIDVLSSVEIGHFEGVTRVYNPAYHYPDCYQPNHLCPDYNVALWSDHIEGGIPYFDVDTSGTVTSGDYVLGDRIPRMFDKRCYSRQLTHALADNGALVPGNWPEDLATPQNVDDWWPFRESPQRYLDLAHSGLKVMLVFALNDHVHPAQDKPHIHQAYDGFRKTADLWLRLNPDRAYMTHMGFSDLCPDNDANSEPADWLSIEDWAYDNRGGASTLVAYAAVTEMADRTQNNDWSGNLDSVIH